MSPNREAESSIRTRSQGIIGMSSAGNERILICVDDENRQRASGW